MTQHKLAALHEFSETELRCLASMAVELGWHRQFPDKPWTTTERKEAARNAIQRIVLRELGAE